MKESEQQETKGLPEEADKIFREMDHILNVNQALLTEARRLQTQILQAVEEQTRKEQIKEAQAKKEPAPEQDLEDRLAELEKMMRQMAVVVSKKMILSERTGSQAADLEERIRHLEELTRQRIRETPPRAAPFRETETEAPPKELVTPREPVPPKELTPRKEPVPPKELAPPRDTHSDIPEVRRNREPARPAPPSSRPAPSAAKPGGSVKKEKLPQKKRKKKIIWDVLFYVVLVFFVVGVFLTKGTGGNGQVRTIAGYSAFTVLSSSMEREIPKGSLVITRHVDPGTLKIGDDITYLANQTTTVTHRIIGIIEEYEDTGGRAFETKGIMNENPDKKPVMAVNVVGKVIYHNLTLGKVRDFICDYWVVILILMVLMGILFRVLKVIFRKDEDGGRSGQGHKKHIRKDALDYV